MKLFFRVLVLLVSLMALYALFETLEKHPIVKRFFSDDQHAWHTETQADDKQRLSVQDSDDMPLRTLIRNGVRLIQLSVEQQKVSGIKTIELKQIEILPEFKSLAVVLSIDELLSAKERYQLIKAELEIVNTALASSRRVYQRLKILHEETSNISSNKLEDARALKTLNESKASKLRLELNNQENKMRRQWGSLLTERALTRESDYFQGFIQQKQALLLMTLKPQQTLAEGIDSVYISRTTQRIDAEPALILSSAPHTDPVSQGESFYLQTNKAGLRAGMRLNVWFVKDGVPVQGVYIPNRSVVWHDGLRWAYIKEGSQYFIRRALHKPLSMGDSWVVNENFKVGEFIVTQGAQQLLSEEFRASIPDEDDDP